MVLKLSEQFTNVLSRISHNKISKQLLNLQRYCKDIKFNYIDISDTKNLASYTPSDKVEKIMESIPDEYVINGERFLTKSDKNDSIFTRLGYNKYISGSGWRPSYGEKITIISETISEKSGNIYCYIQDSWSNTRSCVINKACLKEVSDKDMMLWSKSRNSIKVGRMVSSILQDCGVEFIDKEIEEFVNLYKASYDFIQDVDKQFSIVKGKDISFWYKQENYVSGGGILSNSCMCQKPSEFFDIYSKNVNQCSLVILYSDNGRLSEDGSYLSDKIKGRAILWDVMVDGKMVKFLDRIYTNQDSDVQLFIQYADKNGWYHKKEQSMYPDMDIINEAGDILPKLRIKLEFVDHDRYPYIDTMCYFVDGILTNDFNREHMYANRGREYRHTDGTYCYHGRYDENDREVCIEVDDMVEDVENVDEQVQVESPTYNPNTFEVNEVNVCSDEPVEVEAVEVVITAEQRPNHNGRIYASSAYTEYLAELSRIRNGDAPV